MYREVADLLPGQVFTKVVDEYWFVCKTHGMYRQILISHKNGRSCQECGGSKTLTIEKAEARFPEMVKGQTWTNASARYWFVCEKHGEYLQRFGNRTTGYGCIKCGRESTTQLQLLDKEEAYSLCPDMIEGQTWSGVDAKYWFVCESHGRYLQIFYDHRSGKGCKKCANAIVGLARRLTIREAEARYPDMVKGQTWSDSKSRYWFICDSHGAYLQMFADHKLCGCQKCSQSKGERAVATYLSTFTKFTSERMFKGLGISKSPYRYDFCVEDMGLLIEYHGSQHYKPVGFFGGKEGLLSLMYRDQIKAQWAQDNGWHLITVPYWEKDIEEFLDNELLKLGHICSTKGEHGRSNSTAECYRDQHPA